MKTRRAMCQRNTEPQITPGSIFSIAPRVEGPRNCPQMSFTASLHSRRSAGTRERVQGVARANNVRYERLRVNASGKVRVRGCPLQATRLRQSIQANGIADCSASSL